MSRRRAWGCAFLLVALAALGAFAWREARVRAERRLRAELRKLEQRSGGRQRGSFGQLELRPLQLGGSLRDVRFETHGAQGEPLVLEVDELRLERFMPEVLGGATDLDATALGLHSAALDRELARLPGLSGKLQTPCRIEAHVKLHYDPQEPRPLSVEAQLRAPGLGRTDLRLVTRGLAARQLEGAARLLVDFGRSVAEGTATDEHALDALSGAALLEAELSFEDDGLAPALLEREAQRMGLSVEQARDKLRVDLWRRLEPGPTSLGWVRQAGQAAETFVGEPRLRLRLDPAAPVEFSSLPADAAHGTQALAELLGLSVEANAAR